MTENILQIKGLTKTYAGGKRAVENLTLSVRAGEIHGFIGPNGAGKTTTIRALVGLLKYDAGEILIDGKSLKDQPVACKSVIAYIPDNPDLYDFLTGIQYLNYMSDMFGVSSEDREQRIKKYADLWGMTANLGNMISSYSHGMKQKLALISAFIHKPRLLILDEPFVGLDPQAAFSLKQMMAELCKTGSAIFFSTHVLEVAEKLCDRVSIIKDAKLISTGTMAEVRGDKSLEDIFMEVMNHE